MLVRHTHARVVPRLAAGVLLAVVLCCAHPILAKATQLRGINITPFWATQMTRSQTARELDAAAALGADVIRVSVPWPYLQPRGPHSFDRAYVAKVDWLLAAAHVRGLRVLMQLGGTPCWASDNGRSGDANCAARAAATYMLYPPRHFADFASVARWVASRWGSKLVAMEVHNEANTPEFWRVRPGQDAAVAYMHLLSAGYHAIKRAAPGIVVLGGTIAMSDTAWLQRLESLGLRRVSDAVSIHPYDVRFAGPFQGFGSPLVSWGSADEEFSFHDGIPAMRATMTAAGDPHPLWLTEFGYATCPSEPYCVSEGQQASWLAESFGSASTLPYVQGVLSYCLRDYDGNPAHWASFGLLHEDFRPKPAFAAVRRTLALLRGDRRPRGSVDKAAPDRFGDHGRAI